MKLKVLPNQTLVDIAMQVYGSAEGVIRLATENGLSVTDDLKAGQPLTYSTDSEKEKKVTEYYSSRSIHPATAFLHPEIVFDTTFDNTFRSFDKNE